MKCQDALERWGRETKELAQGHSWHVERAGTQAQVLWPLKPVCPSPGDRQCLTPVLETATVTGFHSVQQAPCPGLHVHLPT